MSNPQHQPKDDPERIILANINEYGWHAVNIIEDDGHPPWSILRLAGPFTRPCVRPAPASQRRDFDSPSGFCGGRLRLRCHVPVTMRATNMTQQRFGEK
jgi:hypothetical protein